MEKVSPAVSSDVQAEFRELAKTAKQLNFVSDALGGYVSEIEDALTTLNLGVAAWVVVHKYEEANGFVTERQELGYDKIGKHWCICLQSYRDAEWQDEPLDFEKWAFNEGPRALRTDAIDLLPELIKKLNTRAATLAKSITDKLPTASRVAKQISGSVEREKDDRGNKK